MDKEEVTIEKKNYEVLAVGGLLIDLIGQDVANNLGDTSEFQRFQGGSAANLVCNMAKLNYSTALVAAVGEDYLADYLLNILNDVGVDTQFIMRKDAFPTSMVLVSRSLGTADWLAYRMADKQLDIKQVPDDIYERIKVLHTTCFALSRRPAQTVVMQMARKAKEHEKILSLNVKFSPKNWPNPKEAVRLVKEFCAFGPIVKVGQEDVAALFPNENLGKKTAITMFHEWGAKIVALTFGKDGSMVSDKLGSEPVFIPSTPPERLGDATGTGDTYWAAFLGAMLSGKALKQCALEGSRLASIKISYQGPLPPGIDRKVLEEEMPKKSTS